MNHPIMQQSPILHAPVFIALEISITYYYLLCALKTNLVNPSCVHVNHMLTMRTFIMLTMCAHHELA